jgi:hypothetical protein
MKMAAQQLPPWDNDPLSTFFRDAAYNERASSLNFVPIFALLQRIDGAVRDMEGAVEKDNVQELERVVPRLLAVRTHGSFLAGMRLAMSGQLSESCAVLRGCIELCWYALHIAKDPKAPDRANIWLNRGDDVQSKRKCQNEFRVSNMRSTHELIDRATAKQLREFYEVTIDFGGHPNEKSLFGTMSRSETENETNYKVGILSFHEPHLVVASLRLAAGVAIGVLKVFQLIFTERFAILSLDSKIDSLVMDVNAVFTQYAQKGSGQGIAAPIDRH